MNYLSNNKDEIECKICFNLIKINKIKFCKICKFQMCHLCTRRHMIKSNKCPQCRQITIKANIDIDKDIDIDVLEFKGFSFVSNRFKDFFIFFLSLFYLIFILFSPFLLFYCLYKIFKKIQKVK